MSIGENSAVEAIGVLCHHALNPLIVYGFCLILGPKNLIKTVGLLILVVSRKYPVAVYAPTALLRGWQRLHANEDTGAMRAAIVRYSQLGKDKCPSGPKRKHRKETRKLLNQLRIVQLNGAFLD